MANYSININKAVEIKNFENSGFDLFYEDGVGAKLTDKTLNVQIFKKDAMKFRSFYEEKFENDNIIIAFSSNEQKLLSFEQFNLLQKTIDTVKKLLESENVDQKYKKPEKKRNYTYVGGIYQDKEGNKYLYLGKGFFSLKYNDGERFTGGEKYVYAQIKDENLVSYDEKSNTFMVEGLYSVYAEYSKIKFDKCLKTFNLVDQKSVYMKDKEVNSNFISYHVSFPPMSRNKFKEVENSEEEIEIE